MIRHSAKVAKSPNTNTAYNREYYRLNRTKLRKKHLANYQTNREKILAREKELRDPVAKWAYMLQYKFGITVEKYEEMFKKQEGKCLICKRPPSGRFKRLAVDHCHKTGEIRGLLCSRCNRAIGYFYDDPALLQQAVDYLGGMR